MNKAFLLGAAFPVVMGSVLPNIALAQTTNAAPATVAANVPNPRYEGNFTSGSIDKITYTPSCPTFDFDMDAMALYNSNDKKFLQAQYEIFKGYEKKFDNYKSCVISNGKADNDLIQTKLVEHLTEGRNKDAGVYNPLVDTFAASVSKKFKAAPKDHVANFGDDGVTAPTGRLIGTSNGNTASTLVYTGGCGYYKPKFTAADIDKITVADDMNQVRDTLLAGETKLKTFETCRNENVNADFKVYGDVINKGVNKTYNAFRDKYVDQTSKVARQFDIKLKNGLIK